MISVKKNFIHRPALALFVVLTAFVSTLPLAAAATNGTKIAYARGNGVFESNSDGSTASTPTTLYGGGSGTTFTYSDAAYSPDGTRVAFVQTAVSGGASSIVTVLADGSGGGAIPITTTSTTAVSSPSWSADGTKIAYARGNGVFESNSDGSTASTPTTLYGGGSGTTFTYSDAAYSPDGTRVAFVQTAVSGGASSIVTVLADGSGGGAIPITTTSTTAVSSPSWSADGTKIAYARGNGVFESNSDGSTASTPTTLYGGGSGTTFTYSDAAYSPDGTRVAFVQTAVSGGASSIVTVLADGSGGGAIPITTTSTTAVSSPSWEAVPTPTPPTITTPTTPTTPTTGGDTASASAKDNVPASPNTGLAAILGNPALTLLSATSAAIILIVLAKRFNLSSIHK